MTKVFAISFSRPPARYTASPRCCRLRSKRRARALSHPYGNTKQICEDILRDTVHAYPAIYGIALRYFNPIGAHPSALIGELPKGVPMNLVPFITQTAAGLRECLSVFGDDYDTPDGSAVRDYIDVTDLARAHVVAVDRMTGGKSKGNYDSSMSEQARACRYWS